MLHRSNQFYPNITTLKQSIHGQIVNQDQVGSKDAVLFAKPMKKTSCHYMLNVLY